VQIKLFLPRPTEAKVSQDNEEFDQGETFLVKRC
jgi:hypothetical protein